MFLNTKLEDIKSNKYNVDDIINKQRDNIRESINDYPDILKIN